MQHIPSNVDLHEMTEVTTDSAEICKAVEDALRRLDSGLTSEEVEERHRMFGFNEIVEKKENPIKKFLLLFWGPIPIMIILACILSAIIQSWEDFAIILSLLIVNAVVRFIEERQAGNALKALQESLAVNSRVIRNCEDKIIPARELVPGDIIDIRLGDIIPADCVLLGSSELVIDQSALTGESLTVDKRGGSIIRMGETKAAVTSIGEKTFFGKSAALVNTTASKGRMQQVLVRIGNFLIIIAAVMVAIVLVMGIIREKPVLEILDFCTLIVIASIPVALPTVLSVTLAVGVRRLASFQCIVSRMTAVEELASMDILCSDKTGTLTKNQLTVDTGICFDNYKPDELLVYAALGSRSVNGDAIDSAITGALPNSGAILNQYQVSDFEPFDPIRKRTQAYVLHSAAGERFYVSKGAPQVIELLCITGKDMTYAQLISAKMSKIIAHFASKGFRALGVARTRGDQWEMVGVIPLFDPPRDDAAETIRLANELGVSVRMITGDQVAIARETAKRLGMGTNILDATLFSTPADSPGGALSRLSMEMIPHGRTSLPTTTGSLLDSEAIIGTPAIEQPRMSLLSSPRLSVGFMPRIRHSIDMGTAPLLGRVSMSTSSVYDSSGRASLQLSLARDLGEIVERANGFAQVFPEHKYRAVELLQERGHVVGMTGDGVNDAPALKKADIGIAVQGATDAARSAASIVLLAPGLGAIVDAIQESRRIFNRMRSYVVYQVHSTLQLLLFISLAMMIYDFYLPGIHIVLLAIINDGTVLTIASDRSKFSQHPETWDLKRLITLSSAMGLASVGCSFIAFWYFSLHLSDMTIHKVQTMMYIYLAVSGQLTIFLSRTSGLFFLSMPSIPLLVAVPCAQLIAVLLAGLGILMEPCGWSNVGVAYGFGVATVLIKEVVKLIVVRLQEPETFCGKKQVPLETIAVFNNVPHKF